MDIIVFLCSFDTNISSFPQFNSSTRGSDVFSVCPCLGLQSHSDQLRKASQEGQGKEPSCALWIALMVGETGRTGGKKMCLSMCCVCGNLCSSSLDLPCCSGNQGNCSQSGEAGWNHNSPIDTSLHSATVQTQQAGRGNVSPTLSCLGDTLTATSGAAFLCSIWNTHQDTPSEL